MHWLFLFFCLIFGCTGSPGSKPGDDTGRDSGTSDSADADVDTNTDTDTDSGTTLELGTYVFGSDDDVAVALAAAVLPQYNMTTVLGYAVRYSGECPGRQNNGGDPTVISGGCADTSSHTYSRQVNGSLSISPGVDLSNLSPPWFDGSYTLTWDAFSMESTDTGSPGALAVDGTQDFVASLESEYLVTNGVLKAYGNFPAYDSDDNLLLSPLLMEDEVSVSYSDYQVSNLGPFNWGEYSWSESETVTLQGSFTVEDGGDVNVYGELTVPDQSTMEETDCENSLNGSLWLSGTTVVTISFYHQAPCECFPYTTSDGQSGSACLPIEL